jgi:hypothetical protein
VELGIRQVLVAGSGTATPVWTPRAQGMSRGHRIAAAVAVGAVVLHGVATDPRLSDDAYISFRYAANLASSSGLVFNVGHRVEGFSNPLWTLLLAGAYRLHLSLPATSWVLGLVFLAATVWLMVRLAARTGLGMAFASRWAGAGRPK